LVQLQHSRRSTQLRIILKGMSHAGISCPLTPVPHAPGDGSPRMPADINVAPSAMFNHVLLLGGILTRSCRRARETPLLKKAAIAAQLSARRAARGRAREDMMTRKTLAGRALVLAGLLLAMRSADAAPPTAVPSPGYDARLREERSARIAPLPGMALPTPLPRPRPQHRHRHRRRAIGRGSY
jgi:hypothetical protein